MLSFLHAFQFFVCFVHLVCCSIAGDGYHDRHGDGHGHRRQNGDYHRGGRGRGRRGGRGGATVEPVKFEGEFDFESANARFKKDEVEEELSKKLEGTQLADGEKSEGKTSEAADSEKGDALKSESSEERKDGEKADAASSTKVFYEKDSFFDNISCSAMESGDKQQK